jgi:hypothetical protein
MPTHTKPPPAHATRRANRLKGWYMDPERDEKDRYLLSGLLAGLIFFVIDVVTGGGVVSAIGLSVIIGVVTVAVSFVISRTLVASMRKRS